MGGAVDPAGFGDWVYAQNSVFRNNITGVRIRKYHRFDGFGVAQANRSWFNHCEFITDGDWPDLGTNYPKAFAELYQVDAIKFLNCAFRNEAHALWSNPNQWGWGIRAQQATINCTGGLAYAYNRFANLTVGVQTWTSTPLFTSTVDGMGFQNNWYGMIDWADVHCRITNNRFENNTDTYFSGGAASIGLLLQQSEDYTVERNTFIRTAMSPSPAVGIWFKGPSYNENQIYNNDFTVVNAGCVVEGTHVGIAGPVPNTPPGLQMRCGEHTNNWIDQVLLPSSAIRTDQGLGTDGSSTANNLFTENVDCDIALPYDPSSSVVVVAFAPYPLHVDYHYYHQNGAFDPRLRPECVEDMFGAPLSSTGDWFYDLNEHLQPNTDPFDPAVHCIGGDLDMFGGTCEDYKADLVLKQTELASAVAAYNGAIDGGNSPDLVAEINQSSPWQASWYLRDLLLGNNPLSDQVLVAAVKREQPLDQWHLTQVLIDNSPLTPNVWGEIESAGVLSPYFVNLLQQFGHGISTRKLLEQEIIQRSQEKAQLQRLYFMTVAQDSTLVGKLDSIASVFNADTMYNGHLDLYRHLIANGDYAGAALLEGELASRPEADGLLQLGALETALQGDWDAASTQQRAELLDLAYSDDVYGSAEAWAIASMIGELDSLPPGLLPEGYRSAFFFEPHASMSSETPLIGVVPNPAKDRVVFTYPDGVESATVLIQDAQGRIVLEVPLNGRRGMSEVGILGLDEGLYLATIVLDGMELGTTRFTIVR